MKTTKEKPFLQRYCRSKQVTINNDGMLGVKLAGLSFASMEKITTKVSQQNLVS
jgi:hypothetical protein